MRHGCPSQGLTWEFAPPEGANLKWVAWTEPCHSCPTFIVKAANSGSFPAELPSFLLFLPLASSPPLVSGGAPSLPSPPGSPSLRLPPAVSVPIPQLVLPAHSAFVFWLFWCHVPPLQPTWNGGTAPSATASPASPRPPASTTARAPAPSPSTSSRSPGWCWHRRRKKLSSEPTSKSHTHHQKPLRNWPRSSTWKPAPWSTGSTITGAWSPRSPASWGMCRLGLWQVLLGLRGLWRVVVANKQLWQAGRFSLTRC